MNKNKAKSTRHKRKVPFTFHYAFNLQEFSTFDVAALSITQTGWQGVDFNKQARARFNRLFNAPRYKDIKLAFLLIPFVG